jgi:two-component system chemotaxis sensor kinase CheA
MDERARAADVHAELAEAIDRLELGVRRLCDERAGAIVPDPDLVNEVFREAHSLKGLAGLFGEPQVGALAHAAEDLLEELRMGRLPLSDDAEDVLTELPEALVESLESGREADLVGRLRQVVDEAPAATNAGPPPVVPPELRPMLTSYEEHRVAQALAQGQGLYGIQAALSLAGFDVDLRQFRADVAPLGEVLATLPVAKQPSATAVACELLLGSRRTVAELEAALGKGRAVRPLAEPRAGAVVSPRAHRTVRVDIRRLDRLMSLLGDLTLSRLHLGRIAAALQAARAPALLVAEILHESHRLESRIDEMQRAALSARMVPLEPLFARTRRLADRLAKQLGKEVEIRFEGGDVEIDKVLAEALAEPLVHLVHNAVDHGIELPEARIAAGKPRRGSLTLRASQRGGMVMLDVVDDGAGIDPERVRKAAEKRGLISSEGEPLSPADVVRLLLTPGFSTAAGVSAVSGRGVGLDAVRAKVVSVAGFLEVVTRLGEGSTFTLALPATLALVRGLVVRAGDHRYAMPVSAIWEIAGLADDHGERLALEATGESLPLVSIVDLFGLEPRPTPRSFAAVVGPPDRRVGLVLDGIEGQRDLVMKPLGGALGPIPGVAGLAQLGPEEPVLVLDVPALVDEALGRPALRANR